MKDVIVERCCGNCEWSISPECEEEIMKENHYEEDDTTRPRAGDCCLGVEHDGKYICEHHMYLSGGHETYYFYEEKDLGPGYYVVDTYCDHIIRYFKLYRTGEYGKYNYGIKAYEVNPIISDCGALGIRFEISKVDNELLYKLFSILAKALGDNVIRTYEENNNSFLTAADYKSSAAINFSKVINDKEVGNNFIDIKVKCDKEDRSYRLIEHLFRNMAVATCNMKEEDVYKMVRKLSRR